SAALEVAVARALCRVSGVAWDPTLMARLCQTGENRYVGVSCGIMDQYAAANACAGTALLLDCRSLSHVEVTIPADVSFVVLDTGVRRKLASSEYNRRRASCEEAVALIAARDPGVRALRDVAASDLLSMEQSMEYETYKRAQHVVEEIARPQQMAEALDGGDLAAAGRVMNESHFSLRDLYEVSSSALDEITELARNTEGCCGARMTGAGFGGCAIALVETSMVDSFVDHMRLSYRAPEGATGYFHASVPSDGARLVGDSARSW
ncbi:MAG: galactokinase, partial [Gemmatimonadota bacterium]